MEHDQRIVVFHVISSNEARVVLNTGYYHDRAPIFLRLQNNHYDLYESAPKGEITLNLNEGYLYQYRPNNNLDLIRGGYCVS